MTRRIALAMLATIYARGIAGAERDVNVTIDLDKLKVFRLTWQGRSVDVQGEEIFKALVGQRKD